MSNPAMAVLHSSLDPNWRTPPDCFGALDREFRFLADLAADATAAHVPRYLGPGSLFGENALTVNWTTFLNGEPGFLNPPFSRQLVNAYRTGKIKIAGRVYEYPIDPDKARTYDIAAWAEKCWVASQSGATVVGLFPFAPQTEWYRQYVYGHELRRDGSVGWAGHAAVQERRIPHRISYLRADGSPAANAGVNTAVVVWTPARGLVGPWTPWTCYWSYRASGADPATED